MKNFSIINGSLLAIGIVIILGFSALFLIPFFIDWQPYKHYFEKQLSQQMGREVMIRGRIDVRFIPKAEVKIRSFVIPSPFGKNSNLDIPEMGIDLDIVAFALNRPSQADEIRLYGPVVQLRG